MDGLIKIRSRITVYKCSRAHAFTFDHKRCPICSGEVRPVMISSDAVLITHTTVHVNPSTIPLTLGIAKTKSKAKTLCIVIGGIRGNGRDRVTLLKYNGLYYALARKWRNFTDQMKDLSSNP